MSDEHEEQRILNLITTAAMDRERWVARDDRDAWTELWVAATAINRLDREDHASIVASILEADPQVPTIFMTFLLMALRVMENKFDRIVDGEVFEHDGMTLQAVEIVVP